MVSLVEQMLAMHKQLRQAQTPHEKTALQRAIEATDGQIGSPANGLTDEEIGIVEATGRQTSRRKLSPCSSPSFALNNSRPGIAILRESPVLSKGHGIIYSHFEPVEADRPGGCHIQAQIA